MGNAEGKPLTLPFLSDTQSLSSAMRLDRAAEEEIERVHQVFPFRVPLFYAGLMDPENPLCPIRLQAVPTIEELSRTGVVDPLGEANIALTPAFFKRYPGRGVFLTTAECAMYCRFCNRRRLVGKGFDPTAFREETLAFIETCEEVREVILSGGDPLMLDPVELDHILTRLRRMDHVKAIRVSSRMPVVFPERVELHRKVLKRHAPLWFIIHINHPREVTPEFIEAVKGLQEARLSCISQTVLLRRVNDCRHILGRLFELLVHAGVKPYYLFQLDDVTGATHFKVRIEEGLSIMRGLRAAVSGLCVPQYALDITGGLGKIPLEGPYLGPRAGNRLRMENIHGEQGMYLDNGKKSKCNGCGICKRQGAGSLSP
jgi:lysine 2,3-aminomutase